MHIRPMLKYIRLASKVGICQFFVCMYYYWSRKNTNTHKRTPYQEYRIESVHIALVYIVKRIPNSLNSQFICALHLYVYDE